MASRVDSSEQTKANVFHQEPRIAAPSLDGRKVTLGKTPLQIEIEQSPLPKNPSLVNRRIVQTISEVEMQNMSMEQIMRELLLLLSVLENEYNQVAKEHSNLLSKTSKMAAEQLEKSFNTIAVYRTQVASALVNIGAGLGPPLGLFTGAAALARIGATGSQNIAVINRILPMIQASAEHLANYANAQPQAFSTSAQLFSQGVGAPATYYQQESQKAQSKWTSVKQSADSLVQSHQQEDQQLKQRAQEFLGSIKQLADQMTQLVNSMHRQ